MLLNTVGQRVMYDLRSELYQKLQRQEVAYFDRQPVGRIMTRLTSDVDALNELFTSGIIDVLGDVVMIFVIIGIMLAMDWRLTLITLVTVPLLVAATSWFRKGARRGYDMVRTRLARINAFLQEHLSGAQVVQLFNRETRSLKQFHELNDDYRRANIETIFYYAVFFPLVDLIGAVGIALIIWFGGWRVLQTTGAAQALTLGALVAFIQYSQQLFQPIRDISDKYNVLQAAMVASHRLFRALDLPVAVTSPTQPRKTGRAAGRIEFQNVWFAYKNEEWVLKDVSFVVEPGQSVALVGHTGSGKTTITNLLMRFYDVQRGRVLLDGVDVRDWDLKSLRENFAVVLQDVFLFSGTIAGNIRLGRGEMPEARIEWAAREVRAEPFI
ncbi:MAG: ABC transporter ATP-binding protein/permease, partial [Acidobacteria bacterium]|nr:ABC transporter ATP-binding protein/permease [Acidobacteriota bacterium]